jgi:phytanoyl-CoA hydroxylase
MLSLDQIEQYKTEGFLVIKDFASADECRTLRERAQALVTQSGPRVDPRSVFDTNSKHNKLVSHSYFMESTDNVSLFFEASAVAPDGTMLRDKTRAIVKIGHALHDYDPVFESYSHSHRMHEIARDLGYKKPLIGQSRYFFRLPEIKIEIPAHQDSTMLYTSPSSCYLVWLALEKVTLESGCMWVSPGSHGDGVRCRYVKDAVSGKGRIENLGRFKPIDDSSFIPLEVDEGSVVLMSGELFHKSNQNRSSGSRQAYALHFIEGNESHEYPLENWLQRPGGFGKLRHLGKE